MITEAQLKVAYKAYSKAIFIPEYITKQTYKDAMRVALEAAEAAAWRPIEEAPKDGTKFLLSFLGEVIIASWSHVYSNEVRELVGHNVKRFDGQATVQSIKDGWGRMPEGLLWAHLPESPK